MPHSNPEAVMPVIERFRSFLNSAWPALDEILREHDWDDDVYFIDDWVDANWELLVCRQLLGKDCDLQPFAIATNDIKKNSYKHRFESTDDRKIFVSLGTGQESFRIAPPFDRVRVLRQDGVFEVLPWSSLQFELSLVSQQ